MLHGTITKPVDITYVKKHESCFEPMKDCLFIDYIIIVSKNKFSMRHYLLKVMLHGKFIFRN